MANENWDQINLQKKNDIAWQGAKRGAIDLVSALIQSTKTTTDLTVEGIKREITGWSEFIYALEPKTPKKQFPKGRVSASQKDYLKSLYLQKEDKEFGEDYYENMGSFQASKEITRLKAMPTVNSGDGDFRDDFHGDIAEGKIEYEEHKINANK